MKRLSLNFEADEGEADNCLTPSRAVNSANCVGYVHVSVKSFIKCRHFLVVAMRDVARHARCWLLGTSQS